MSNFKLEPGELIMGVGDGSGNLFVKGDYDSITVLQQKLFELEELRRGEKFKEENAELRKEIEELRKEARENDIELIRLRLEVASLRSSQTMTRNPYFDQCPPYSPKYPGQDIIWCSTSSLDTGAIKAKGF